MDDYLSKPLSLEKLSEALARCDLQPPPAASSAGPEWSESRSEGGPGVCHSTAVPARVDRGVLGAILADFGEDATYPIEANLDLLNAIDFRKGCFIGQETTSRMKRRGQIKSRMLPITGLEGPLETGAEVLKGELRAGEVRSTHGVAGLALVRLDRLDGALSADGRAVEVRYPDWIPRTA
jgi:folate-binding protein YgfZ